MSDRQIFPLIAALDSPQQTELLMPKADARIFPAVGYEDVWQDMLGGLFGKLFEDFLFYHCPAHTTNNVDFPVFGAAPYFDQIFSHNPLQL
jgi:hypothetical protein